MSTIGVVMTGGGARGAYQAGVLNAIAEISQQMKIPNPLRIFTGSSAGSVNSVYMAAGAHDFYGASKGLVDLWANLKSQQVFASDPISLGKMGIKWFDSSNETFRSRAFLDTTPLQKLLQSHINSDRITDNIDQGFLDAVAVTAVDYSDSQSVTFVQAKANTMPWHKTKRFSHFTQITVDHIMASSAIPILFPPHGVDGRYYGDGCVGQASPCGPAIYLGAEKLIVIGVRKTQQKYQPGTPRNSTSRPSLIGVFNVLLDTVMFDGIEKDLEKLDNTNHLVQSLSPEEQAKIRYKGVDYLYFSPSVDFNEIAKGLSHHLPRIVRFMLRGLGSLEEASEIVSYLLFHPSFCAHLIDLGFDDAMKRKDEIIEFLKT